MNDATAAQVRGGQAELIRLQTEVAALKTADLMRRFGDRLTEASHDPFRALVMDLATHRPSALSLLVAFIRGSRKTDNSGLVTQRFTGTLG